MQKMTFQIIGVLINKANESWAYCALLEEHFALMFFWNSHQVNAETFHNEAQIIAIAIQFDILQTPDIS